MIIDAIIEVDSSNNKHTEISENKPKVAIVILNFNGLGDTIRCLESLKKIKYSNYEVIVVDNGSEGEDARILEERYREWATIIKNERNLGAAEGRNVGIRFALKHLNPDYVMLLDNDVIVDAEFLNQLVEIAESNREIGILSSKDEVRKGHEKAISKLIAKLDSYAILGFRRKKKRISDRILLIDYVSCCSILVRRRLLEEVGLFDSKFFYLSEDYDLCKRARRAGYKVAIALNSRIWHKKMGGVARKSSALTYYFRTRNYLFIMRKHGSLLDWLRFIPFYILNLSIRFIFYSLKKRTDIVKALIKGLHDGIFETL